MINAIPGVTLRELPLTELCCGSTGVYNVEHTDVSMALLEDKIRIVESTGADT